MKLVKHTPDKHRSVYELEDCYRKVWHVKDREILEKHVSIMNDLMPGYVLNYGYTRDEMWLDVKKIEGTTANTFEHTPEFVERIYKFCLDNIEQTYPYAHYDWVLSNMIINNNNIQLIDWDNVGIYSKEEIMKKLHADLKSAFGDKFDPAGI